MSSENYIITPQTIVTSLKAKYGVPDSAQTIASAIKQIPEAESDDESTETIETDSQEPTIQNP